MELNTNFAMFLTAIALIGYTIYCIAKRVKLSKALLRLLFIGYIGAVIAITLFPLIVSVYPGQSIPDLGYNLIPLSGISNTIGTWGAFQDWRGQVPWIVLGGNIVMFAPLGIFLPLIFPSTRRLGKLFVTVLLSSCAIELAQLFLGLMAGSLYRCVDIDDVILNTLGGLLGYAIYRLIRRIVRPLRRTEESPGSYV